MIFSKKATSITCLKRHIAITLIFSLPFLLLGQTESVYKVEFKNVGQNAFTQQLIARSSTAINTNWNNYKGGAMHTDNALFHFNSERLVDAFPTHSAIHTNNYLLYYFSQKTAKCPTLFSLLNYYEPVINENLTKNNLPKELKLLPAVLSAFNPFSNNQMGGTGFWHLNYPQAIKYGLVVNETIDERMDFEKSTKAATACLKDLHEMYNDWELTLTAYATGVVTVSKLLKRHAATTYKEIYPCLPTPTQDMVQAYVAMNYVYNYDTYGAIALNPVLETDTILIAKKLKFEALNHILQTNTNHLAFLNPTLTTATFPSDYAAYLPKGKGESFNAYKDSIYYYQDSVLLKPKVVVPHFVVPKKGEPYVYKVRAGDVLGLIAERNGVKVSDLQAWNDLKGTRIDVGQKLTIYGYKNVGKQQQEKNGKKEARKRKKKRATKNTTATQNIKTRAVYTVKPGDNLWGIAKKYAGVSAQNIMDFNGIDENLKVGQQIKIPQY